MANPTICRDNPGSLNSGPVEMTNLDKLDHLLVSKPLAPRVVWTEIDREARKGKPTPSDHAPLVIDVDQAGYPFDAGWASAEERIATRTSSGKRG